MGSTRGLLHEDEELLAEVRPHPVVVVGPVLLLLAAVAGATTIALRYPGAPIVVAWLLVAMVALPALWALVRLLRWRSVRFLVTTSRLLYRRGVLGRDVVQLRLQRVAEVHCSQSPGGRMIGAGRLVFEVVGGDGPLVVDDVRWPRRLQRLINAQLDRLEVPYGYGGAWDVAGPAGRLPWRRASRPWTDTPPHGVGLGNQGNLGNVSNVAALGADPSPTVPGQILQLDELRRRGILSEDEFAAKKAELLGRL